MLTRDQIERLAAHYEVRVDGLGEGAAAMRVLAAALGDLPLERQTPAFVGAALDELARVNGLAPGERAARADGQRIRLDDPKVDRGAKVVDQVSGADASLEELRERSRRARAAIRADSEKAWAAPGIGARADEDPARAALTGFGTGGLAALAQGMADEHRAAAEVISADEARRAMMKRTENAWQTAGSSIASVAEDLSRRLVGSGSKRS